MMLMGKEYGVVIIGVALVTYLLILQKKFYISGETFADKKISTQMLIK
jgi:hypothetical protein